MSRLVQCLVNAATMRGCALLSVLWSCACCVFGSKVKDIASTVTRQIRSIGFPDGTNMGIFFALGIPLDVSDKSISFSFYFEAIYPEPGPQNSTDIYGYLQKRSLDRSLAYDIIESKFERAGYPGRSCLLRSICEAAANPVTNNGLVGDIIHILFTPSSSMDEDLPSDINEAEHIDDCSNLCRECPISLLDFISENAHDNIVVHKF